MFTVALIGGDGAGKTTIAKKLIASYPLPIKYIYMGMNASASNFALPTMRMVGLLKRFFEREAAAGNPQDPPAQLGHTKDKDVDRGKAVATLRLFVRLGEEWFRQFISWYYQLRGYIVVYDRHFKFDHAPQSAQSQPQRLTDRLHWWILDRFYPDPDLVILLDAPPDVLLHRKHEGTFEYLQGRRVAYLEQGEKTAHFVRINATQPLDVVFPQVIQNVVQFHKERDPGAAHVLDRIREN